MSRAIDILAHEHEAIVSALNLLDCFAMQMRAEQAVGGEDVLELIGVLREFADRCHHGKEETILFPALVRAELGAGDGLVKALLHEHDEGRRLLAAMEEAARAPLDVNDFTEAAGAYLTLLRAHIARENTTLFPQAEAALSAAQLDAMAAAFDEFEVRELGPQRHEQLHATLKRLQKRYLM